MILREINNGLWELIVKTQEDYTDIVLSVQTQTNKTLCDIISDGDITFFNL